MFMNECSNANRINHNTTKYQHNGLRSDTIINPEYLYVEKFWYRHFGVDIPGYVRENNHIGQNHDDR